MFRASCLTDSKNEQLYKNSQSLCVWKYDRRKGLSDEISLQRKKEFHKSVRSATMTRDSKYIITQHWKDQQICIFDLQTFIESEELCRVATLKGNYSMKTYVTGGIKAHSIAVSCIGGFVAAGSEDHKLRVWDAFPSATTSTHLLVLWCHMIIKVGYGNAPRIMMQITRFLWRRYGRRVCSSVFERSRSSIVSLIALEHRYVIHYGFLRRTSVRGS